MKNTPAITLLSSVAALLTSPLAFANEPEIASCAEFAVPEVVICEMFEPKVTECGFLPEIELPTPEIVVDGEGFEGVDPVKVDEEVVEEVTDENVVFNEGSEFPIEWVRRTDGENPEVLFQTMSGAPTTTSIGGGTSNGGSAALATEQDEQANAILVKDKNEAPQITRDKQGPVAVLTEGRVFLR